MAYDILRKPTVMQLIVAVNAKGATPVGGPFFDDSTQCWCQAVTLTDTKPPTTPKLTAQKVKIRGDRDIEIVDDSAFDIT